MTYLEKWINGEVHIVRKIIGIVATTGILITGVYKLQQSPDKISIDGKRTAENLYVSSVRANAERLGCNRFNSDGTLVEIVKAQQQNVSPFGVKTLPHTCPYPEYNGFTHTHLNPDDSLFSRMDIEAMSKYDSLEKTTGTFCVSYGLRNLHCQKDTVEYNLKW